MQFIEQYRAWLESGRTNMEKVFATISYTIVANRIAAVQRVFGQDALGGQSASGLVQTPQDGTWFQSTWPQTYSSAIFALGVQAWSPDVVLAPDDVEKILNGISLTFWRNKTNYSMGLASFWPSGKQPETSMGNLRAPMLLGGNPLVLGQTEQVFVRAEMLRDVTGLSVAAGEVRVQLIGDALNHYPARAGAAT